MIGASGPGWRVCYNPPRRFRLATLLGEVLAISWKPLTIRCSCGHRVVKRDVLQTAYCLIPHGPAYVLVRYRCGRCRRVGQEVVDEEDWTPDILGEWSRRPEEQRYEKYARLADITPEEIVDFHFFLERTEDVLSTLPPTESRRRLR